MEIQFTVEQETRLALLAGRAGVAPAQLLLDAAQRLLAAQSPPGRIDAEANHAKVCPECGHCFQGNGWDGIDAHWKARHSDLLPYKSAWPFLKAGNYDSVEREDLEDAYIAGQRLAELRAGRSQTHSLEDVERELGLVDLN